MRTCSKVRKHLRKRWSNHSACGTRGFAGDQAGKEQFYRPGIGAVCAPTPLAPKPQFSVAMAHTVVTGGKMFRQHHGNVCSN